MGERERDVLSTKAPTWNMTGELAPCAESDPTSSWSNRATIHPLVSSARKSPFFNASTIACEDHSIRHLDGV